ncbi:FAD binding domain-containing protein [Geranomyces variabilis]|nr:FAD binding domain-containing protein [Geranomyces variabilis]KAJ3142861.1 hypothetical protein HDU90_002732 [Geranomyces variabilis]
MTVPSEVAVVISGAGPVGLFAALILKKLGVSVRIIDKSPTPSTQSRALVLHVRTMEVLAQHGLLDTFKEAIHPIKSTSAFAGGAHIGTINMSSQGVEDTCTDGLSMIPQSTTERLLINALSDAGVTVERGVELAKLDSDETVQDPRERAVTVTLGTGEVVKCSHLIGADGGHSAVRKLMGLKMDGAPVPGVLGMVDGRVDCSVPIDSFTRFSSREGAVLMIPFSESQCRVIVSLDDNNTKGSPDDYHVLDESAANLLEKILEKTRQIIAPQTIDISNPTWTVKVTCQERMVSRYDRGRVFLAGDAAHVHSPAGGQGLNLGLQDAHALAWRLVMILKHNGNPDALLPSYNEERRKIAADILAYSGRIHEYTFGAGLFREFLRRVSTYALTYIPFVRNRMLRELKGLSTVYPASSPLVRPKLPATPCSLQPGSRAPNGVVMNNTGNTTSSVPLHSFFEPAHFTLLQFVVDGKPVDMPTVTATNNVMVLPAQADITGQAAVKDGGSVFAAYAVSGNVVIVVRPDAYIGLVVEAAKADSQVSDYFAPLFGNGN